MNATSETTALRCNYCDSPITAKGGCWTCGACATEHEVEDDDPVCVCGVYRSEHQLCGCGEGFQTKAEWDREREFIRTLDDDDYERIYHPGGW